MLFLYTNPTTNIIFYKLLIVLIGDFSFSPFCPCLSNFLRLWQTSNRCCRKQWQLKSFFLFFISFDYSCISLCLCCHLVDIFLLLFGITTCMGNVGLVVI